MIFMAFVIGFLLATVVSGILMIAAAWRFGEYRAASGPSLQGRDTSYRALGTSAAFSPENVVCARPVHRQFGPPPLVL